MRRVALAFLATAVLWSTGGRAETAREAIAAAIEKFEQAFNRGDAAALARMYTPEGALLPPGAPRVDGREAIEGFWKGAIEAGAKDLSVEPTEVTEADNTIYEVGTATFTVPSDKGGDRTVSLKYLIVWRQGTDGTWQLHRDIWNENPATGQ